MNPVDTRLQAIGASSPPRNDDASAAATAEAPGDGKADAMNDAAVALAHPHEGDADSSDAALSYTIFDDVRAQGARPVKSTWLELVALIAKPDVRPSKSDCPLIKLATFGNKRTAKGSLRSDENLVSISGIEGDYDAEKVSLDHAADLLASHGVEAVLYTSASNGVVSPPKSNGGPRWRVLAPLSRPHSKDERQALVAMLNNALGGILSPESFTASQTYYFGQVQGVSYQARHVRGECIDRSLALGETYPESSSAPRDVSSSSSSSSEADFERCASLNGVTEDTIDELRSAIYGLNPIRADDRTLWVNVGFALKSLELAGFYAQALELWHLFSARCPEQYDEEQAAARWDGFNPDRITYRSVFKWAQDDGWKNPRKATAESRIDRTDTGNMSLLANITDGDLRYVSERKLWLWWSGQGWEADTHGAAAQSQALRVAEHYHGEAAEIRKQAANDALDGAERKRIEKAADGVQAWATKCRNKTALDHMLALAKADSRFALGVSQLDSNPWLFGVANGVVDLRTGALRDASRADYVTKRSPVQFVPGASAPRWARFISEITARPAGNSQAQARPALASYLQRMLGYLMTGSTGEHKMFIAVGGGANGKNVLLDMFQWVAGNYCESIAPEALMASKHDADAERATPSARKLAGARAAISSESKDGQRLDVALVKRHTGGGYMTARGLHENTFTFEITHKLLLMTNHRPALDHLDDAMKGRLHLIPFDMSWNRPGHPERDPSLPDGDKTLPAQLRAEAEGVLAWLVRGAVDYAREGLEPPAEVVGMTREYFKDQDPFSLWVDSCDRCDVVDGARASELFDAFRGWCSAEGFSDSVGSQTAFSLKLKAKGIESKKAKDGQRYGLKSAGDFT